MKRLFSTYVCVFLVVLLVSCSKDSEYSVDTNLESAYLLQDQLPTRSFDESPNGLYHGAVLSASTTSRGKIWVNIANNGAYNALIELTSGETYVFEVQSELVTPATVTSVFNFNGNEGSFTIDVSDFQNPEITGLTISGQAFYSHLAKSLSSNPASVATASFYGSTDPLFTGTWSFIADGTVFSPNGDNGDGITSVMIVYDGQSYTDTIFDSFDSASCLGNSSYVPTINSFGVQGSVASDYQTTAFAGGMAKWDISYDATTDTYMNYRSCATEVAGTFSWTDGANTVMTLGQIILD